MKALVKLAINGLFTLLVAPIIALFWLLTLLQGRDQCVRSFSQLMSLFPGLSGSYLRKNFYRFCMQHCSTDTEIGFGSLFSQYKTQINSGVYIGPQCNIGSCEIGRDCLVGSGVHIMSGKRQHDFSDLEQSVKDQGGQFQQVSIGEDCWIGNGSLIMANIGKKCVIGAGSVVTQDIPDYSIVAGNPAQIIKSRKQ